MSVHTMASPKATKRTSSTPPAIRSEPCVLGSNRSYFSNATQVPFYLDWNNDPLLWTLTNPPPLPQHLPLQLPLQVQQDVPPFPIIPVLQNTQIVRGIKRKAEEPVA
jgi:hypothetical protein